MFILRRSTCDRPASSSGLKTRHHRSLKTGLRGRWQADGSGSARLPVAAGARQHGLGFEISMARAVLSTAPLPPVIRPTQASSVIVQLPTDASDRTVFGSESGPFRVRGWCADVLLLLHVPLHAISTRSPHHLHHGKCVYTLVLIENSGGVASAIAAALPTAIGGIPTKVRGAVSALLAIEAGWLAWADNQCGNIEAFINSTWLSIGINNPWVKRGADITTLMRAIFRPVRRLTSSGSNATHRMRACLAA